MKSKGHNSKAKKGPEKAFFRRDETSEKPVYIRRMLTRYDVIPANTGSNFGFFINSTGATTTHEWASFLPRYEEYRVRGIRVQVLPVTLVTSNTALVAADFAGSYPGPIVSASYSNGTGGATISDVISQSNSKVHGVNKTIVEHIASWDLNPSAKLWIGTTASIPAQQQFGVEFVGFINALVAINGANTHIAVTEFDVEFRGRS